MIESPKLHSDLETQPLEIISPPASGPPVVTFHLTLH
jgi:hypothetical protein